MQLPLPILLFPESQTFTLIEHGAI